MLLALLDSRPLLELLPFPFIVDFLLQWSVDSLVVVATAKNVVGVIVVGHALL